MDDEAERRASEILTAQSVADAEQVADAKQARRKGWWKWILAAIVAAVAFWAYDVLQWNKTDLDPATNGNIARAAALVRTGEHVDAIAAQPSEVLGHTWNYVGQLFCSPAVYWGGDDQPPGGNVSAAMGGGDAAVLSISTDDAPIRMYWMGRAPFDDIKKGRVCGVLVGRSEKGSQRVLVLVGGPASGQTGFTPE